MGNIRFFLKFGKKDHLKDLVEEKLYCSNATTFWGIEDELKIKGQGDRLEAGTMLHAQNVWMQSHETGEILSITGKSNGLLRVEPAKNIPVYCLFAVYDEDCVLNEDGTVVIALSQEKKNAIREHFPNADGVVIIDNPEEFLLDIRNTIGKDIKDELVHYFNIDKGYETNDGQIANDMRYMKYIVQDSKPVKINGMTKYTFLADFAFRVLFCKDMYFENEQEYRIVLPSEYIEEGTKYPVHFSKEYKISDIEKIIG